MNVLDTPALNTHYLRCALSVEWRSTLKPTRTKLLIRMMNDWGSVLEAAQRLALQVLGALALLYLVVKAILK
jgi:hypothetical protein